MDDVLRGGDQFVQVLYVVLDTVLGECLRLRVVTEAREYQVVEEGSVHLATRLEELERVCGAGGSNRRGEGVERGGGAKADGMGVTFGEVGDLAPARQGVREHTPATAERPAVSMGAQVSSPRLQLLGRSNPTAALAPNPKPPSSARQPVRGMLSSPSKLVSSDI